MGIDRIGKGGPSAPPPPPKEVGGKEFTVSKPAAAERAAGAQAAQAAHVALDRLRSGEIDLQRYLDLKVDQATAHISSLPTAEVEAIRKQLRHRLASDPALADLVRAATGRTPPSDDE